MKFVITGGAGFIGSHLAEKLVLDGHQVVAIDNESTGRVHNLRAILNQPNFAYLCCDVQKVNCWDRILAKDAIIIHLAATVGVNKVVSNALETLENNSAATLLLLNLALRFGCKVFYASTSEVYGDSGKAHSTESDSLIINGTHCGRTSYVLGKLVSEHVCVNYFQQYGLPVVIGRFFNVIGTRQVSAYGMVAPTFIQQALRNEPITVYGDGLQTRNFCDVNDIIDAIVGLVETDAAYGEVFNLGGNQNTTILGFAQYIKMASRSSSSIVFLPLPKQRSEGRDIYHRSPLLEKIELFTKWKPTTPWQNTVEAIVNYTIQQNSFANENKKIVV